MPSPAGKSVARKRRPRQRKPRQRKPQPQRPASMAPSTAPNGRVIQMGSVLSNQMSGLRNQASMLGKYQQQALQTVLPNEQSIPLVLPSNAVAQVCARTIRRNFVLTSSNISASGTAVIVCPPDLYSPAYISSSDPVLVPANPGHLHIVADNSLCVGSSDGSVTPSITLSDTNDGNVVKTTFTPYTLNGNTHYGLPVTSTLAVTCSYTFERPSGATPKKSLQLIIMAGAAAGWNTAVHASALVAPGSSFTNTFTFPASQTVFAYAFKDDAGNWAYDSQGVALTGKITFDLATAANDAVQYIGGTTMPITRSVSDYVVTNQISKGRLTALSLLATNATADIYKQGEVFACRCAPRELSKIGTLDNMVRSLPGNRQYIGPASTGAYVWWMSSSENGDDILAVHETAAALQKEELLLIMFKGLDPTAGRTSINLQVTATVEIYSDEQIFEKIDAPPMDDSYRNVRRMLGAMPAACCNPEHTDLFNSLLSKGRAAYAHYQDNKVLYDSLLRLVAEAVANA